MLVRGAVADRPPSGPVVCAACGAVESPSEWATDPALCSPCRAERTGAVQISSRCADAGRNDLSLVGAAQARLGAWADALESAAAALRDLRDGLGASPSEEQVARLCMGDLARPPWLYCDSGQTFSLSGLPPEVARRMAETTRASGPYMTEGEVRKSLVRRAGRLAEGEL